jgi:transcription initiation factor TFIIIB Brf1 subunit/transcription initiation factor TFIIB
MPFTSLTTLSVAAAKLHRTFRHLGSHQMLSMMEEVINKKITAGKEPMGLAATVLYASSIKTDEKIPQKEIADASGVTEVTIRNRFKDLKKLLKSR